MGPAGTARDGDPPAFALVSLGVEPPAGIEPATPSFPWNHREPLCGPPFPLVAPDRRGRSYRFSSGEVMRSRSVARPRRTALRRAATLPLLVAALVGSRRCIASQLLTCRPPVMAAWGRSWLWCHHSQQPTPSTMGSAQVSAR